jgi:PPP family 3-phenylpropionic acid transporter
MEGIVSNSQEDRDVAITNENIYVKDGRGGWRFALFYFLSCAAFSLYGIYGSLYFRRRGVSNVQLGVLYAIPAWIGIFAPLVWGLISDALRQRRLPTFIMHLVTVGLFPMFWFWNGRSFWVLCVLMGIFTFFFRASIPLADAWTLDHIAHRGGDYGRIRTWGSFGFVVTIFLSFFVLKKSSMSQARDLLPIFAGFCGFRFLSSFYALTLPDYRSRSRRQKLNWKGLRAYLQTFALIFFLTVFMSRFLFGPYYTFFTIFLDEQGIPDNLKGLYWIVAVGAETGLIAVSGMLLKRFRAEHMLLAGLSAMAFRMFVYSLEPAWYIVLATQSLHALTFGAFHVASIHIINRITPEDFRASGQMFNGALLGIGGVLGGMTGGIWAEAYGLVEMFRIFSIISAVTVFLLIILFSIWREND